MSLALAGYAEEAPKLIAAWKTIDHAAFLEPVRHLFPAPPARVLDIGAGIGIDAAWFADQGHGVPAVEPCDELREAGMVSCPQIEWLNDRLPALAALGPQGPFDLVLLSAVWAHLAPRERAEAMPIVAARVAPGGRLIMSVRDGWTPANRPVFPAAPPETISLAEDEGLRLVFRTNAASVQAINRANNVRWRWLAFERPA